MGINANGLRFLLSAKTQGVDFSTTATIGRQGLHLTLDRMRAIMNREFTLGLSDSVLRSIHSSRYAEELLRYLGATCVHTFDGSSYENATHVHDFNLPVPADLHGRYTAVIDGGSLEHIFNFPVAVANCMSMLRPGGHFLGVSPTNNQMGHGFYQFSPELFFRVFSPANGFTVRQMFLNEGRDTHTWFRVADPDERGKRVGCTNYTASDLLVLARKNQDVDMFATPPQQSDYVAAWNNEKSPETARTKALRFLSAHLPASVKMAAKVLTNRIHDPRSFVRIRTEELALASSEPVAEPDANSQTKSAR